MNGHFSYELDERQIKLMMQDAELDDDASFWDKFEGLNSQEVKSSFEFNLPKFHISQSVLIPVLFITVIGILSVMLFSLVDFKKSEKITNEVTYKPIAKPIDTKVAQKPNQVVKIPPVVINKDTALVLNTNKDSVLITKTSPDPIKANEPVAVVPSSKKDSVSSDTASKKQSTKTKKKRRRNIVAEEIPTIIPVRLEEKPAEPDLDL